MLLIDLLPLLPLASPGTPGEGQLAEAEGPRGGRGEAAVFIFIFLLEEVLKSEVEVEEKNSIIEIERAFPAPRFLSISPFSMFLMSPFEKIDHSRQACSSRLRDR